MSTLAAPDGPVGMSDQPPIRPLRSTDPERIGRYRLLGRLAAGGMGMTYLAEDGWGRRVVVKRIREDLADDPRFVARFAREAAALAQVSDPRIVRVLDSDLTAEQPFLVTDYVPGPTLRERIRTQGPLPPAEVREFARELALGVAAMHRAGLAHRDLTPTNVLLGPEGPRVIDLGLAKDPGGAAAQSTMLGTPGWVAPEGLQGRPVGHEADVFLWAALVTYAASGVAPFGEERFDVSVQRVLAGPPDVSAVPTELQGMVHAALLTDPAARPPSWQIAAWQAPAGLSQPPVVRAAPAEPQRPRPPATAVVTPTAQPADSVTARTPPAPALGTPLRSRRPAQLLRLPLWGAGLGFVAAMVFAACQPTLLTLASERGEGLLYAAANGLAQIVPLSAAMAVLSAVAGGAGRSWWRAILAVLPTSLLLGMILVPIWVTTTQYVGDPYAAYRTGLLLPAAFGASMAVGLVSGSRVLGLAVLTATAVTTPVLGSLLTSSDVPYATYMVVFGLVAGVILTLARELRHRRRGGPR